MTSRTGSSELLTLVRSRQRLRRDFDPSADVGAPAIVTGRPADWAEATAKLRSHGQRVLAYHDRFLMARRPLYAYRPVLMGRFPFALGARWLFAGTPRKRFFDAATPAMNHCLWLAPLPPARQAGRRWPTLLDEHGPELSQVLANLHDRHSRETLASLVRGRIEGDAGYFDAAPYPEYGHPVVRARPGDVVIDAGAYNGDSARRFAWQLRGRGKILALEPDAKNFAELARRRLPGLIPVQAGAWRERTRLSFAEQGGSSKVDERGDATVEMRAIDELVSTHGLPRVDLIKLDVEAAENEALDGARSTLERFRPKLQVSIYHRQKDLFDLPLRLMREMPSYRWFLGHHGPWHSETDLYGMPNELLPR